jgi:glycerol uptake facilitator-like aquaporin
MTDLLWQRGITEFIGTFVFLGVIITTTDPSAGLPPGMAAIAIGVVLTAMIFWFGDLTGANFNPAVTTMFWIKGDFNWQRALVYYVAQILGAVATYFYWKYVLVHK